MSILYHFSVRTLQLQVAGFCLQAYSRHRMLGYEWLQCQCIDIQINLLFFSSEPSKLGKRKECSEDLKQRMVNLALKGYCHSTVQYIDNMFKYTGSIKNEPRKPKRRILSAREERYVLDKIWKNPWLSAPKLRGIVENTTRKTICNQTIRCVLHKYDFRGRKVQQNKKDLWWVEETVKIGFELQKNIWIRIKNWKDIIWSDETKIYLFGSLGKWGCGGKLIDETIRQI